MRVSRWVAVVGCRAWTVVPSCMWAPSQVFESAKSRPGSSISRLRGFEFCTDVRVPTTNRHTGHSSEHGIVGCTCIFGD
jgi:hypothetical protein